MFSEKYKTAKSTLSILFVFSMLFSPFYYSASVAFANEDGASEELTTDTVESEPIIETQAAETDESEETILEETPINEEQEIDIETSDTTASVVIMSAMSLDQVNNDSVVYEQTCALPNSLGDSTVEPLVQGWDSMSLQDVFNSLLIDRSVIGDQKQYQTWDTSSAISTITIEFTNKISVLNHVFGYYRNNDLSTFEPIFRSGLVDGFESVPEFSFGQSVTLDIAGAGSIGFAIKTSDGNTYATTNSLNEGNNDHAVAYDWADNTYYVSFEDLALSASDIDYNDVTVKVTVNGCQDAPSNPYCPDGGDMSYDKFIEAQNAGLISFDLSATNTPSYLGTLKISNQTGCTAPISLSSYKVFNDVAENYYRLSTQQFIDSMAVSATSSSVLQVRLEDCMSQMDYWYGPAPISFSSTTPGWPTTRWSDESKFIRGALVNVAVNPNVLGGWDNLPPGGFCPVPPPVNQYCPDGGDMSYDKFIEAKNAGLISFGIATTTNSAYVNFSNQTGCTAPMSLSSYEMFVNPGESNWLSTQQLFDSTGIINATSSTFYEVDLPSCKVQIDFWYGLAPTTLLDSNPYSALPPPVVVDWKITDGNLCTVPVDPPPADQCVIDVVSDTSNQVIGGSFAMATYSQNSRWTASIPGATWIWKTFFVSNPAQDEFETFTKTFNVISTSTVDSASLVVAADNSYTVSVNGTQVGTDSTEFNYFDENKDTYNVSSYLHDGSNIISFTVKNWALASSTVETNPAGLLYKLSIRTHDASCSEAPVNTPPTVTLIGANPFNLTVGTTYTDAGATATDTEDGNLTSSIVKTGTVNASSTGSYILTYSVTDSGGLGATTTRTVIVNPLSVPLDPTVSLSADPQAITQGASSTLSWSSQNTNSCSATWTSATSTSGTMSVSPNSTTDYVITCTGPEGSATATTTVTVNPVVTPPVNPPVTPSGGGGGGGIGGHRRDISNLLATGGEILGATSCSYLRDYLKIDWQNDPIEVLKLQSFLNVFEKENLSLTGVYNQETFDAVARFQTKYSEDILIPWGPRVTTGFVYILTKKKVNEIYCNTIYPLSQVDQNEITQFKALGYNYNAGISQGTGSSSGSDGVSKSGGTTNVSNGNNGFNSIVVGLKDNSSTTGSVIRNAAVSLFALPQKMFGGLFKDRGYIPIILLLILVAIVIAIARLFRGPKNSDKTPIIPIVPIAKKDDKKEPPVIILPGVLPDEEIIIENPEEGPEEVLVTTPDLRDDKKIN